ncbi:MAG: HAD family hydrolase [Bacteroidales bacterium]
MYRLIVFDLDGTLVDSRKDLADATNRLVVERGGRALDQEAVVHMVGEGAAKLVARAFAEAGLDSTPDALPRFLELYAERLCVCTRPYAGVPQMLRTLANLTRLAVLTNKPTAHSEALLAALGLRTHFARIVGGDGPYPRKPDAQSLLSLADEFGANVDEVVLVGDSVFDLRTARAARSPLVLARYGFGFAGIPAAEVRADDVIADTPADVVRILTGRSQPIAARPPAAR